MSVLFPVTSCPYHTTECLYHWLLVHHHEIISHGSHIHGGNSWRAPSVTDHSPRGFKGRLKLAAGRLLYYVLSTPVPLLISS